MNKKRKKISSAKRVVVKLGSSVLAGIKHGGDREDATDVLSSIAKEVTGARDKGLEVVIVSSGALALGMVSLGVTERPTSIPEIQALSAIGQGELMAEYQRCFNKAGGIKVAQVLLTHDDLSDRKRFLNARNTILTLLDKGVVPIINENDTVAVEEIKFGDNDYLAAQVTNLVEADLLVMLTDICSLYDGDPLKDSNAKRIAVVEDVDHLDIDWFSKGTGVLGSGGMASKVEAARKAAHFGISTVVTSGFTEDVLLKVLSGEDIGTLFLPREDRLTSKKHWIAFSTRPTGRVFVDEGAKGALVSGGKSLLPSGITKVDGSFESGEVIHCVDSEGMEFARGITNYSSAEIEKISGHKSSEIEEILGYRVYDEVIHCDNFVLL